MNDHRSFIPSWNHVTSAYASTNAATSAASASTTSVIGLASIAALNAHCAAVASRSTPSVHGGDLLADVRALERLVSSLGELEHGANPVGATPAAVTAGPHFVANVATSVSTVAFSAFSLPRNVSLAALAWPFTTPASFDMLSAAIEPA